MSPLTIALFVIAFVLSAYAVTKQIVRNDQRRAARRRNQARRIG